MPVKHRLVEILNSEKCRHYFEERWPQESPLEINAYKLMVLTDLASGTCLKLFKDPYYLPTQSVLDQICEVFDLQPGDFLYHEKKNQQILVMNGGQK